MSWLSARARPASRWATSSPAKGGDSADGGELEVDAIIWATGYRSDYSWLELPVLDADGRPRHRRGVTEIPGLYFLGSRGSTPAAQR